MTTNTTVNKTSRLLAMICYSYLLLDPIICVLKSSIKYMAVFDLGLLIVSLLTMIIVLFKTSKEKNPFLFSHAKQALNIITLMSFIMISLVVLCFLIWEIPQKILILDVICWFCNAALLIISLIASYHILRGEEHTFAWLPKFY